MPTVASKAYIDSYGVLIAEAPYVYHAPAIANPITRSTDVSHTAWTKTTCTVAKDAVDLGNVPNAACTATASAANATIIRATGYTTASGLHSALWFIKRKTGTGAIALTLDNGTTWQDITSQLSTVVYTGIAVDQTLANPRIGIRIGTNGDAVYIANVGLHINLPKAIVKLLPPVYTVAAAVSQNACSIVLADGNWNNTQGSFYCELLLVAPVSGSINVLGSLLTYDGTNLTFTDGVHSCVVAAAPGVHKIGGVWGAQLRLNVDGVWGVATAYSPWTVTTLAIFGSANTVGAIRKLLRATLASESWVENQIA